MNELVLATYIKVLQDGFARENSQESAARLILGAITNQEEANCTCDLSSKKVSNIVNRKDPVPEDIVIASADQKIINGVYKYFTGVIRKELNPNLEYDVYDKLVNLIKNDNAIQTLKKNALEIHYNKKEYDLFLAETFLYVLGKNNRKNNKSIIQQPKGLLYKSSILSDGGAIEQIYKTFSRITRIEDICVNGKYVLEGPFSFDSFYDNDGARIIRVKTEVGGLVVCGDTSLDNWLSRSYVNNVTKVESVTCIAWLKVLEKNKDKMIVHYFAIGDGL